MDQHQIESPDHCLANARHLLHGRSQTSAHHVTVPISSTEHQAGHGKQCKRREMDARTWWAAARFAVMPTLPEDGIRFGNSHSSRLGRSCPPYSIASPPTR